MVMERQVFISYSSKDVDFINLLKTKLTEAGFDVWIDKDLLEPGKNWRDQIDFAIKASFAIVVVLTPKALESKYVTYEWAYGLGLGKTVIPIKLEEFNQSDLHPKLEPLQYIDFTQHFALDDAWERLIKSLGSLAANLETTGSAVPVFVQNAVLALDDINNFKQAISRLETSKHPAAIAALIDATKQK